MANINKLNSIKLKIKAISLADESKTIRRLEKGCETEYGDNPIYEHRIGTVRQEARATQLARAFLHGIPYKKVECSRKDEKAYEFGITQARAFKIAKKYGEEVTQEAFAKWITA